MTLSVGLYKDKDGNPDEEIIWLPSQSPVEPRCDRCKFWIPELDTGWGSCQRELHKNSLIVTDSGSAYTAGEFYCYHFEEAG